MSILLLLAFVGIFGYEGFGLFKRLKTNLTRTERDGVQICIAAYIMVYLIGILVYAANVYVFFGSGAFDDSGYVLIIILIFAAPIVLCAILNGAPKEGSERIQKEREEKVKEIEEHAKKNERMADDFFSENHFSQIIEYTDAMDKCCLCVDESKQEIVIFKTYYGSYIRPKTTHISFDDIIKCEIDEDGAVIEAGGVGRAIVGSLIAGGAGAIVGAVTRSSKQICSSMNVRIYTTNVSNPQLIIPLIKTEVKRSERKYLDAHAKAKEIYAIVLAAAKSTDKENECNSTDTSSCDDAPTKATLSIKERIQQLNSLKDEGLITEEEYREQRNKILKDV